MGLMGASFKLFCLTFVVLTTRSSAPANTVIYRSSERSVSLPRLFEASIDDLNLLQGAGVVNSVGLVEVRKLSLVHRQSYKLKSKCKGIYKTHSRGQSPPVRRQRT